ncbi:MAG: acyl-CoA desaturase [Myxococcales bacterium]|nr:acyl-CoA desaturase [Myxococcales bacterium]MCB9644090.1 acyl-CoA desaturase [Myxococcales bacterium]
MSVKKQSLALSPGLVMFVLVHIACFAAIWTGVHARDLMLCAFFYIVRMFGVTAGYHRYFSHRTYKTSRVMQFLMALLASSSAQKGVLWWAGHHRVHHKHSDTDEDMHSPVKGGFWWSHVLWMFYHEDADREDPKIYKEFSKYPEILWLEKISYAWPILLGAGVWYFFGWSGVVVGFLWSTVLLWHGTFTINSLCHVFGSRRYATTDDSRNNFWLAMVTLGEGWHNNHHHYQSSTRQGFFWWEIDITYYILKMMSWVGLVWELREPPRYILENRSKHAPVAIEATNLPHPSTSLLPPVGLMEDASHRQTEASR